MKLTVLSENSAFSPQFSCEHGLSVHVCTSDCAALFDTGASDLFLTNAAACGIDLSTVSCAVISHGHYDHGGGIAAFLRVNQTAPVYLHDGAFAPLYSRRAEGLAFIGLPPGLNDHERLRIISCDSIVPVCDHVSVFSGAEPTALSPAANKKLLIRTADGDFPDPFLHEQYAVFEENGTLLLYTGCAHRGIVNIMHRFCALFGRAPDLVAGGFHLGDPRNPLAFDASFCAQAAAALASFSNTLYLTGHCTGSAPYEILFAHLGARLIKLSAGAQFDL